MKIDFPQPRHMARLRQLWQLAFGDTDAFLDSFFRTAYAPDRCLCVFSGDDIAAALYWMDCALEETPLAYIYAVATHPDHRGKGLCRMLMADTHALLARRGYAGALLVPGSESLRQMYAGMGYANAGGLEEIRCAAGADPVPLRAIGPGEFAALRRQYLPPRSVIQEGHSLAFLAQQLRFYTGEGFLLAACREEGILHVPELLGDASAAPGITAALNCREGHFRIPGGSRPHAMFLGLTGQAAPPRYFGFAFD